MVHIQSSWLASFCYQLGDQHSMFPFTASKLFLPLCLVSLLATAQQSSSSSAQPKDPQAITILNDVISAGGGAQAIGSLQDFTAKGTITFNYANSVASPVTIKGRGLTQFRLDASLPEGMFSWAVTNGSGFRREATGETANIPYHNAINLGVLTLPYAKMNAALSDSNIQVTYIGLQSIQGQQFYQIRISSHAGPTDPSGKLQTLQTADYFVDPASYHLLAIQDHTHPVQTFTKDVTHAVYFSDFRTISGILVPFSIVEKINDQKVWSTQLSDITFNGGLTDTDFKF